MLWPPLFLAAGLALLGWHTAQPRWRVGAFALSGALLVYIFLAAGTTDPDLAWRFPRGLPPGRF